jgi:hypothetical protein
MKGEIKEVEIGGKKFELKKQGVDASLTAQSLFYELVMKAGKTINMDKDLTISQLGAGLMAGMRGDILREIKALIKECVNAPIITDDSYEDIPFQLIPELFSAIYHFQTGEAEKKSEEQSNTEK